MINNNIYPLTYIKMTKEKFLELRNSNKNFLELKALANKYGYECERAYVTCYGEPRIALYPLERRFTPNMYLHTEIDFDKQCWDYRREMSTVSFGSLEWEELEKYVDWVIRWKAFYDELIKIDLHKLERQPNWFDD